MDAHKVLAVHFGFTSCFLADFSGGCERCMSVESPLQEYKMHSADILFKEDATVDDLIDVIEGNRRYIRCLYVFNKIDVCSIEEVDEIARRQVSIPISAGLNMNMDGLLEAIWEQMGLVRVYTKKVGSSTSPHTRP